jgi:hypothetical protein
MVAAGNHSDMLSRTSRVHRAAPPCRRFDPRAVTLRTARFALSRFAPFCWATSTFVSPSSTSNFAAARPHVKSVHVGEVGSALANALVVPPVFPNGDVIAVSPTDRKCHKFDGRFGMRNEPNAVQDRSALRRIFRAIRCYLRRFAQGVDHIKVLGVRRIVDGQSRARAWPGRSGAAAFSPCRVRRNRNEPARPREGDILCESGGRRR